jgi:hypothetical protein
MWRTNVLLLIGALAMLAQGSFDGRTRAQATGRQCPIVTVSCPTGDWTRGELVSVYAQVSGADSRATLKYRWSVSAGRIKSGQGTPSIRIDTSETAGQSVTATLYVGGLAGCPLTASCSLPIIDLPPPEPRLFDQYSDLTFGKERQRLDRFAAQLRREPDTTAYIVVTAGGYSSHDEVLARIGRARRYLITRRGIKADRIVFADGGTGERLTFKLNLLPPNHIIPTSYPIIVPAEETTNQGTAGAKRRNRHHKSLHLIPAFPAQN